jgi:hypothetical protein
LCPVSAAAALLFVFPSVYVVNLGCAPCLTSSV